MIHIQYPKYQLEIVHMDWVTASPTAGDRSFNACLVLVERYSKTLMFLQFHRDYTAIDTDIMIWNRVIINTGLFKNLISDRDPKLTSALWTNIHRCFGEKLLFSIANKPQADGL
ncbi:hypothetical protein O181_101259 [Austropuccinia psidii MF-1]|uniref:Integrase catalytic domain-containing protein n=1 Tax=Austropuccinia psidii MF-1 TaxID=1389203 RepID=A0A9Q3PH56_9BASI|nr:hypothetical protein [Austropuccinia psidii MF-1]